MVDARFVIGIVGNIISFGLFLSQIPTYVKIVKRKDVENFSPNPALATMLNCAMWVFYGLPFVHPHSTLVWTINGIGLLMEAIYIIIYLCYANNRSRLIVMGKLLAILAIVSVIDVSVLEAAHGTKRRTLIVGIICIVLNILMYAMPLDSAWTVWKTKSVEYMPFWLLLANLCNGAIWAVYGLLPYDFNLVVCNGAGFGLGVLQVGLYTYISCHYPQEKKGGNEVELATTGDANV
ncbi:hypothetical protein ACHQM5_027832 [Ranunculus cassubicifolius]